MVAVFLYGGLRKRGAMRGATGLLLLCLLWPALVSGQPVPGAVGAAEDVTTVVASGGFGSSHSAEKLLPPGRLFEPLVADPRWPHFSISYQRYLHDDELKDVGAASFGEYFSFYHNQSLYEGSWEVGLQAGINAVFDLGASSQDLVNADYWIGLPFAYRRGDFSALLRLYHQSSHLGDEFLLRKRPERVDLSYEGIDLLLSWDIGAEWRLYGGGGYLVHRQPGALDPGKWQAGIEWRHSKPFLDRMIRPVAAFDARFHQEYRWDADISTRAGVQFEDPGRHERYLQILLEYFKGKSPNGQFFQRRIEYWGIGLHFYLP